MSFFLVYLAGLKDYNIGAFLKSVWKFALLLQLPFLPLLEEQHYFPLFLESTVKMCRDD